MAHHYVRDLARTISGYYTANGLQIFTDSVLYHFLRVAGFEPVWECDGDVGPHNVDPTHVLDGNMEAAGGANWTTVASGVVSKDSSVFDSGTQSLKVVAAGSGDGVRTAALVSVSRPTSGPASKTIGGAAPNMTIVWSSGEQNQAVGRTITISGATAPGNNGTFLITGWDGSVLSYTNPSGVTGNSGSSTVVTISTDYEVVIWAANNGPTWTVEADGGGGSFSSIGTIPNNGGVFTRYSFTLPINGSGSKYVRLVATGAGTIYVDGMLATKSYFERPMVAGFHEGSDGILANPDTFSTGGSYSPDVDDVGSYLFVFDPTNPGNSGAYEILADLGGGVVQLDLRSPTAELVAATGLEWRIVPLKTWGNDQNGMADWVFTAGFGLESPHSSGWRLFLRQNLSNGQTVKNIQFWSAPEATKINYQDGHFWRTAVAGKSCMRNRCGSWSRNVSGGGDTPGMQTWHGPYWYTTSPRTLRNFIMLGEDLDFAQVVAWDANEGSHGFFGAGFTRSTPPADREDFETFIQLGRWGSMSVANEFLRTNSVNNVGTSPTVFDQGGLAREGMILALGYGTGTDDIDAKTDSVRNPFSGREWLRPAIFCRDPFGEAGDVDFFNVDPDFLLEGRTNLPDLTPFGDDVSGTGDSIAAGTPATVTDAAGAFTADMVGRWVEISGAPSGANNGVFKITGFVSATQIQIDNPSAVTEAAPAMTWAVSSFSYLHFDQGVVWPWPGEAIV